MVTPGASAITVPPDRVAAVRRFGIVAVTIVVVVAAGIAAFVTLRAALGPAGLQGIPNSVLIVVGLAAVLIVVVLVRLAGWNRNIARAVAADSTVVAASPTGLRLGAGAERPWSSLQSVTFVDARMGPHRPTIGPSSVGIRLGERLRARTGHSELYIDTVDAAGAKDRLPFGSVLGIVEFTDAYRLVAAHVPSTVRLESKRS